MLLLVHSSTSIRSEDTNFLRFNILQIKLLRLHWLEKGSQSLSIIYKNGESSLDLVFPQLAILSRVCYHFMPYVNLHSIFCSPIMFIQIYKDRDQAECWYLGLNALISAPYTPLLLVDSTRSRQISNRRINSCTNSPPSSVQQRSKLFAVHDGRNFTKVVHSDIHSQNYFYARMLYSLFICKFVTICEFSHISYYTN
jgi:hypothetical protein